MFKRTKKTDDVVADELEAVTVETPTPVATPIAKVALAPSCHGAMELDVQCNTFRCGVCGSAKAL